MKNFLLLFFSSFLIFIFSEIVLRIAAIGYPFFYDMDSVIGGVLAPGAEGWQRDEGEAYIQINSHGMRDEEHSFQKPDNTFRVAILGDSYMEALQVDLRDSFGKIVETNLNSSCKKKQNIQFEVLNFGVSGYGTTQEYLTLKERVWRYDPDLVLLAITTGNDIRNNSIVMEPEKYRPFYILKNNELHLDNSFSTTSGFYIRKILYPVIRNSRILQLVHRLYYAKQAKSLAESLAKSSAESLVTHDSKSCDFQKNFLNTSGLQDAWTITEKLLLVIRDEIKAKNKKALFFTVSNPDQIHSNHPIGIGSSCAENRLYDFGKLNGLEIFRLAPRLRRIALQSGKYLHIKVSSGGFGHWSKEGHLEAGKMISEQICRQL